MSTSLGIVLWMAIGLNAAPIEAGDAASDPIRTKLQQLVDDQQISGGVVAVGRRDGILSIEAVGLRDLDAHLPMTKDTIFRIASMTKPITAIGIMMLVDEGKLAIADPVEQYLPEFRGQMLVADRSGLTVLLKRPSRSITIRDLLTHTSGLPTNYFPGLADVSKRRSLSLAEAVMAIAQRPLEFEPGSKWEYCSAGIDTLGRIIEVVAGQPFDRFLQQRVFTPLEMTDTTFDPSEEQRSRLAVVYQRKDGRLRAPARTAAARPTFFHYPSPAGGLYSTAADLSRLYRMMLGLGQLRAARGAGLATSPKAGTRLLCEASVRAMTSLQTGDLATRSPPGLGFGLGWFVVRRPEGWIGMFRPGAFGHGGAFNTQAWIDPAQDLFSVLLIQRPDLSSSQAEAIRGAVQALAVAKVAATGSRQLSSEGG